MDEVKAPKERYEKPMLRTINLVAQEVLAQCKVDRTSPGPRTYACRQCHSGYGTS